MTLATVAFSLCYFPLLLMCRINSIIWISIPINQCDNNENLIKIIIFAFAFSSAAQFWSINNVRCEHHFRLCLQFDGGVVYMPVDIIQNGHQMQILSIDTTKHTIQFEPIKKNYINLPAKFVCYREISNVFHDSTLRCQ